MCGSPGGRSNASRAGLGPAQKPGCFASGGLTPAADEVWQIWNDRLARDAEPIAKVVPEWDAEFGSSAHQSEERVAAIAAIKTARAATDLALG
jgi:hypothetical protein